MVQFKHFSYQLRVAIATKSKSLHCCHLITLSVLISISPFLSSKHYFCLAGLYWLYGFSKLFRLHLTFSSSLLL